MTNPPKPVDEVTVDTVMEDIGQSYDHQTRDSSCAASGVYEESKKRLLQLNLGLLPKKRKNFVGPQEYWIKQGFNEAVKLMEQRIREKYE